MEIGILNILDKKDISAERIVLQVREDCNSWVHIPEHTRSLSDSL